MATLREHKRPILALVGLVVLGGLLYAAWLVYELIRPQALAVINQSDEPVTVVVGTWYRMDVDPQSRETLATGWFPLTHNSFAVFSNGSWKNCSWSEVEEDGLLVDSAGAHCTDLAANQPRYPFNSYGVTPTSTPPTAPAPP